MHAGTISDIVSGRTDAEDNACEFAAKPLGSDTRHEITKAKVNFETHNEGSQTAPSAPWRHKRLSRPADTDRAPEADPDSGSQKVQHRFGGFKY